MTCNACLGTCWKVQNGGPVHASLMRGSLETWLARGTGGTGARQAGGGGTAPTDLDCPAGLALVRLPHAARLVVHELQGNAGVVADDVVRLQPQCLQRKLEGSTCTRHDLHLQRGCQYGCRPAALDLATYQGAVQLK